MKLQKTSVRVSVPGSSANLGPGFDVIGLAIDLRLNVAAVVSPVFSLSWVGVGTDDVPHGNANLVHQAFVKAFEARGLKTPTVEITCRNQIPIGKGLGSSAASTIAGLLLAREIGLPMEATEILKLAKDIEGHCDNAAASLLGGLTVVACDADPLVVRQISRPDLGVALFLPNFKTSTTESRQQLPTHVSRSDAVFNMSRLALLIHAIGSGDYDLLKFATQDRLHEPYRTNSVPGFTDIVSSAIEAGAFCATLSGSGPSIVALTPLGSQYDVAAAMRRTAEAAGVEGMEIVTRVGKGAEVT